MKTHCQTNTESEFYSEYIRWKAMKRRCYNKNSKDYVNYGKRGIEVCERWKNSFENFIADMGKCPKNYSIERIDVNKNYTPENCKWASNKEQATNKRNVKYIEYNGKIMPAFEVAKINGIKRSTFSMRISKYGWSVFDSATKRK